MLHRDLARRALLVIASLAGLTACSAGTNGPTDPPAWLAPTDSAKKDLTSGTALERYFPIVDGKMKPIKGHGRAGEPDHRQQPDDGSALLLGNPFGQQRRRNGVVGADCRSDDEPQHDKLPARADEQAQRRTDDHDH